MSYHLSRRELLAQSLACGATLAAPQLSAALSQDADKHYADAIFHKGEPPLPESKSFTIAVLPDTQFYSQSYPETYVAQTRWIVENLEKRNICAVLHLGDITNHNTPEQWQNAQKAMQVLDDKVPYFLTVGNHDCGKGGGFNTRETLFNKYFPLDKYSKRKEFGGVYDREPTEFQNNYHLLNVQAREFLVLALEVGPRSDVIRWANEVVAQHPKREVILLTHAFLYHDDTRYDWKKYGKEQKSNPIRYGATKDTDDHDGEGMWQNLVQKHPNFVLTINGHVASGDGLGRLVSKTKHGHQVPQVLVDFQAKPKGGDGWLRLLEFTADQKLRAIDYSPTRGECNVSDQNRFTVDLPNVG
jgi:hypothetical protein